MSDSKLVDLRDNLLVGEKVDGMDLNLVVMLALAMVVMLVL